MAFDLEKFEQLVESRVIAEAGNEFYDLLNMLSINHFTSISELISTAGHTHLQSPSLESRLCHAIDQLILTDEFEPAIPSLEALMQWQIVLSKLYYLSPFGNSDYLLERLIRTNHEGVVPASNMLKIYLLLSTESTLNMRLEHLLVQNPDLYLATCLMQIWGCSGTEQSCGNREWAYQKIRKLLTINSRPNLPLRLIHGYFMHASYGFAKDKHYLKSAINTILKAELLPYQPHLKTYSLTHVHQEAIHAKSIEMSTKKVILVILEIFNNVHSVYRVLGKSLLACKNQYILVAVAWPGYVSIQDDYFDYILTLSGDGGNHCLDELYGIVQHFKPAAVYYPSIGMSSWAIDYSNIRLAPIQFTTIGHGASSFATEIDYFLIEEDIAGDATTYSEKVIKLPVGSMPFNHPQGVTYSPKNDGISDMPDIINIVCSASVMKLNFKLLDLCKRINQRYNQHKINIKFTFIMGSAGEGIASDGYRQLIAQYLPDAKVYAGLPLQAYIDLLAEMDLSLSTYPYSGMNTVVDYAMLGIPGVRMDGPEVHEAIEAGMWRRMGMPEWLIAHDESEYEAAVCRLIDQPETRLAIRQKMRDNKSWKVFFDGDANVFAQIVDRLITTGLAE